MTKDLTSGSPLKVILLFSLPLVLGNLFQQFYALADTIIVGRFCGVSALASVGATGSVNYLILGFVIGVCNGFAIPIAQLFGARDYSDLRRQCGADHQHRCADPSDDAADADARRHH